jgi:hypothetical protein
MACRGQLMDRRGRQADAVFMVLDFLRAANAHRCFLASQSLSGGSISEKLGNVLAKWPCARQQDGGKLHEIRKSRRIRA